MFYGQSAQHLRAPPGSAERLHTLNVMQNLSPLAARARQKIKNQPQLERLAQLSEVTVHTVVRFMAELDMHPRNLARITAAFEKLEPTLDAERAAARAAILAEDQP